MNGAAVDVDLTDPEMRGQAALPGEGRIRIAPANGLRKSRIQVVDPVTQKLYDDRERAEGGTPAVILGVDSVAEAAADATLLDATGTTCMGDLARSEALYFRDLQRAALPESLDCLINLEFLRFASAEMTKLPDAFGRFEMLRDLQMHRNELWMLPTSFR